MPKPVTSRERIRKGSLRVPLSYCTYFVLIYCFRQRDLKLALNVCHKTRAKRVMCPPQMRGAAGRELGVRLGLAVVPARSSHGRGERAARPDGAVAAAERIVIFITEDVFPTKKSVGAGLTFMFHTSPLSQALCCLVGEDSAAASQLRRDILPRGARAQPRVVRAGVAPESCCTRPCQLVVPPWERPSCVRFFPLPFSPTANVH